MAHPPHTVLAHCDGFHRHFLTICTHARTRHFVDAGSVDATRLLIFHTARERDVAVLAYCFMPDHLHLVIEGVTENADPRKFVAFAKQRTGYMFARRTGQHLWQRNYFDRTLRNEDSLAAVVRYVIDNPIRAGLVSAPDAYPYWGSGVYSRQGLLEFVGSTKSTWRP